MTDKLLEAAIRLIAATPGSGKFDDAMDDLRHSALAAQAEPKCDGKSDFCFRAIRDKELDDARAEGFDDGIEAAYQKGLSASATWTRPIHRQHPKEEK